ncbi:hypothetical protein [uncultured Methylibium sp.]|uniref:hypothetical protein n=1 Tax=uncultured Methylibium sp. TaxID=381093 RepID=UPI0025F71C69|nr:hypothetical protein [uncultured Methylibium sp.]
MYPRPALPSWHRLASAIVLGLAFAGASWADSRPACKLDPFAMQAPADRELVLHKSCGKEHLGWRVEAPRPAPNHIGPSLVRAQVESVASRSLLSDVLGSVKFGWTGRGDDLRQGVRTERALLAAGAMLRTTEAWSLQVDVGREITPAVQQRATLVGQWHPTRMALLFAEWTGSDQGAEYQRVGARWWVVSRRLAVDLSARYDPQGWDGHFFGLTLHLP